MMPTSTISNSVGTTLNSEADQELHALRAALDDAAEAAGLALQVKAQRQRMEVAESGQRQVAHGALRHRREDGVADFAESLGQHARQAIGQDERHRHRDRLQLGIAEGVDRVLVEDRDVDVGDLGQDQQDRCDNDAAAQAPFALRPQMRRQGTETPLNARLMLEGGRWRGRHCRNGAFWGAEQCGGGRGPSHRACASRGKPLMEKGSMSFRKALLAMPIWRMRPVRGPQRSPDPGTGASGRVRLRDHLPGFAGFPHRHQRRALDGSRYDIESNTFKEGMLRAVTIHYDRPQPRLGRFLAAGHPAHWRVASARGRRQDPHMAHSIRPGGPLQETAQSGLANPFDQTIPEEQAARYTRSVDGRILWVGFGGRRGVQSRIDRRPSDGKRRLTSS